MADKRASFKTLKECFQFLEWLSKHSTMQSQVAKELAALLKSFYHNADQKQIIPALSRFLGHVSTFYKKLCKSAGGVYHGSKGPKDLTEALLDCIPKFLTAMYHLWYKVDKWFDAVGGGKWKYNIPGVDGWRWWVLSYGDWGGGLQKYLTSSDSTKYGVMPGGFDVKDLKEGWNYSSHEGYYYAEYMAEDIKKILRKYHDMHNFFRDVFVTSVIAPTGLDPVNTANAVGLVGVFCEIVNAERETVNGGQLIQKLNEDLKKQPEYRGRLIDWAQLRDHCSKLKKTLIDNLFARKGFNHTGRSPEIKNLNQTEFAKKTAQWFRSDLLKVRHKLRQSKRLNYASSEVPLNFFATTFLFPHGFIFGKGRYGTLGDDRDALKKDWPDIIRELEKDGTGLKRLVRILKGETSQTQGPGGSSVADEDESEDDDSDKSSVAPSGPGSEPAPMPPPVPSRPSSSGTPGAGGHAGRGQGRGRGFRGRRRGGRGRGGGGGRYTIVRGVKMVRKAGKGPGRSSEPQPSPGSGSPGDSQTSASPGEPVIDTKQNTDNPDDEVDLDLEELEEDEETQEFYGPEPLPPKEVVPEKKVPVVPPKKPEVPPAKVLEVPKEVVPERKVAVPKKPEVPPAKTDSARPVATKTEATKPVATKVEATKTEATKPVVPKSEGTPNQGKKSEGAQNQGKKAEGSSSQNNGQSEGSPPTPKVVKAVHTQSPGAPGGQGQPGPKSPVSTVSSPPTVRTVQQTVQSQQNTNITPPVPPPPPAAPPSTPAAPSSAGQPGVGGQGSAGGDALGSQPTLSQGKGPAQPPSASGSDTGQTSVQGTEKVGSGGAEQDATQLTSQPSDHNASSGVTTSADPVSGGGDQDDKKKKPCADGYTIMSLGIPSGRFCVLTADLKRHDEINKKWYDKMKHAQEAADARKKQEEEEKKQKEAEERRRQEKAEERKRQKSFEAQHRLISNIPSSYHPSHFPTDPRTSGAASQPGASGVDSPDHDSGKKTGASLNTAHAPGKGLPGPDPSSTSVHSASGDPGGSGTIGVSPSEPPDAALRKDTTISLQPSAALELRGNRLHQGPTHPSAAPLSPGLPAAHDVKDQVSRSVDSSNQLSDSSAGRAQHPGVGVTSPDSRLSDDTTHYAVLSMTEKLPPSESGPNTAKVSPGGKETNSDSAITTPTDSASAEDVGGSTGGGGTSSDDNSENGDHKDEAQPGVQRSTTNTGGTDNASSTPQLPASVDDLSRAGLKNSLAHDVRHPPIILTASGPDASVSAKRPTAKDALPDDSVADGGEGATEGEPDSNSQDSHSTGEKRDFSSNILRSPGLVLSPSDPLLTFGSGRRQIPGSTSPGKSGSASNPGAPPSAEGTQVSTIPKPDSPSSSASGISRGNVDGDSLREPTSPHGKDPAKGAATPSDTENKDSHSPTRKDHHGRVTSGDTIWERGRPLTHGKATDPTMWRILNMEQDRDQAGGSDEKGVKDSLLPIPAAPPPNVVRPSDVAANARNSNSQNVNVRDPMEVTSHRRTHGPFSTALSPSSLRPTGPSGKPNNHNSDQQGGVKNGPQAGRSISVARSRSTSVGSHSSHPSGDHGMGNRTLPSTTRQSTRAQQFGRIGSRPDDSVLQSSEEEDEVSPGPSPPRSLSSPAGGSVLSGKTGAQGPDSHGSDSTGLQPISPPKVLQTHSSDDSSTGHLSSGSKGPVSGVKPAAHRPSNTAHQIDRDNHTGQGLDKSVWDILAPTHDYDKVSGGDGEATGGKVPGVISHIRQQQPQTADLVSQGVNGDQGSSMLPSQLPPGSGALPSGKVRRPTPVSPSDSTHLPMSSVLGPGSVTSVVNKSGGDPGLVGHPVADQMHEQGQFRILNNKGDVTKQWQNARNNISTLSTGTSAAGARGLPQSTFPQVFASYGIPTGYRIKLQKTGLKPPKYTMKAMPSTHIPDITAGHIPNPNRNSRMPPPPIGIRVRDLNSRDSILDSDITRQHQFPAVENMPVPIPGITYSPPPHPSMDRGGNLKDPTTWGNSRYYEYIIDVNEDMCNNPWNYVDESDTLSALPPPPNTDHLPPPTTVRGMLYWLLGLVELGYIVRIKEHVKVIVEDINKDASGSSPPSSTLDLTREAHTLDASHVSQALIETCLYAANVIYEIKHYNDYNALTSLKFDSQYSQLYYSSDSGCLVCQLKDYVYACHHQLTLLKSQCSRNESEGGWQECQYGHKVHDSPLQDFLTDAPTSKFETHPFDPYNLCLKSHVKMGFGDKELPEKSQPGSTLYGILSPICGVEDPLLKLSSYLNCITKRTPRTTGELVSFFHNFGNSLHDKSSRWSMLGISLAKQHDNCPEWDHLAAAKLQAIEDARGSAPSSSNHQDQDHANTLSALIGCGIDNSKCPRLMKPITYGAYALYSPIFVHDYLGWTVYLADRLWESLLRLHYDLKILQCHDSKSKSLHQCEKALLLLYSHGFTPPDGTLQSSLNCSKIIAKLKELVAGKPIATLMTCMDNFLYKIRKPFLYTLFTVWSIAMLFFAHTMLYRLDVLASHLIDVKALLAGSRRMLSLYRDIDYFDDDAVAQLIVSQ
ncbi:ribosome binding protein [Babesia ovata]|uniref:Ribosome binding protein n=1 Tax=Babesia ovata TaxID=189622 RepID=A0A2H6K8J2_9APIC|nr:ribosome binding protein [Babesia ovata]GBE59317.1 ribosome binding protein [Babesia ovata]